MATVIAGPGLGEHLALRPGRAMTVLGNFVGPARQKAEDALRAALSSGRPSRVTEGPSDLFVDVLAPCRPS